MNKDLALKISKHPMINKLMESVDEKDVARLIAEELVNEGDAQVQFLKDTINNIKDANSYQQAEKEIEDMKKTNSISDEEHKSLLALLQQKKQQLEKTPQQTKDEQPKPEALKAIKQLYPSFESDFDSREQAAILKLILAMQEDGLISEGQEETFKKIAAVLSKFVAPDKIAILKGSMGKLRPDEQRTILKIINSKLEQFLKLFTTLIKGKTVKGIKTTADEEQPEPDTATPTADKEQPDKFDLTSDQEKNLKEASVEFINEFYEQQYLFQQGQIVKRILSVLLSIKSGEEKEMAAKSSKAREKLELEEAEEDKLEASKGRLRSIQIAFRTFLQDIKVSKKALAEFLKLADQGSIVASSTREKFIKLMQRQQRDIVTLFDSVTDAYANLLKEQESKGSTELKWERIEKNYDIASEKLRGLLGLSDDAELKNSILLIDDTIEALRELTKEFPNVNPFKTKDPKYDDLSTDYSNAVEEAKRVTLRPILELTRTGSGSKAVLERALEGLKEFSQQIATIFGVKSQFKDAPPPPEKKAPAAEPDAEKPKITAGNKITTGKPEDEMFAEFQTVATKLFDGIRFATVEMKALYNFYKFMKGSEIKANLQENIFDKLGDLGYEKELVKKFVATLDGEEYSHFASAIKKVMKNNLLDKLPELITLKISDTGKKKSPEATVYEEFDIEDLYAVLVKHKDTYEKAKKLIKTGSLNEDKRLANLKKVEDEFDNQADVLKNMFGVLDGLDSQSKKSIIKAAQTFVDLYDELQVTYETLKGKEIGEPEAGILSRFVKDAERAIDEMEKDLQPARQGAPKAKQTMSSIKRKVLEVLPIEKYKVLSRGTTKHYSTFVKFVLFLKSMKSKTNESLEDKIVSDSGLDRQLIKKALEMIKQKSPEFLNDIKEMFTDELKIERGKDVFSSFKLDDFPTYEGDFFSEKFKNYSFKPGGFDPSQESQELNDIFFNGKQTLNNSEAFIMKKFKDHLATQTKIKTEAPIKLKGISANSINDFKSTLKPKQKQTFKNALDKIANSPYVSNLSNWLLGKELKNIPINPITGSERKVDLPSITNTLVDQLKVEPEEAEELVTVIQNATVDLGQQSQNLSQAQVVDKITDRVMQSDTAEKIVQEPEQEKDLKNSLNQTIDQQPEEQDPIDALLQSLNDELENETAKSDEDPFGAGDPFDIPPIDDDSSKDEEEQDAKKFYYSQDGSSTRALTVKQIKSEMRNFPYAQHQVYVEDNWVDPVTLPEFSDFKEEPKTKPENDEEFRNVINFIKKDIEEVGGEYKTDIIMSFGKQSEVIKNSKQAEAFRDVMMGYINSKPLNFNLWIPLFDYMQYDGEQDEFTIDNLAGLYTNEKGKSHITGPNADKELSSLALAAKNIKKYLSEKEDEELEEQIANKLKPLIKEQLRRSK